MDVANEQSDGGVEEILAAVQSKGVRLWSENGELRYKAPKGALTRVEIEKLREGKRQILELLECAAASESVEASVQRSVRTDKAPLTLSQLEYWNFHRLGERRTSRQLASAKRLVGRLQLEALRKSLEELVRRHGALRIRMNVVECAPVQTVTDTAECIVVSSDLTDVLPTSWDAQVQRTIQDFILQPVDVAVDPLFAACLIRLADEEHILILAMQHIISDAFSLAILWRDFFTAYRQLANGQPLCLPDIRVQFVDYAIWQRRAYRLHCEKHGSYWRERLEGCRRVRFPRDQALLASGRLGWGTVPLMISASLKGELVEWCRLQRTTLVMSVFTTYVALVLCLCDASEAVFQYQSDGRVSPALEHTIGYFAAVLYLRVKLAEDDSLIDLMKRVTDEYCRAYEHVDFSDVALEEPRPEFARNTIFNWVPQTADLNPVDLGEAADAISCQEVSFEDPELSNLDWDHEPGVLFFDTEGGIVGRIYFPLNRFTSESIERFARNYIGFIRALIDNPLTRVRDILLL